jgi:hypothetical protein
MKRRDSSLIRPPPPPKKSCSIFVNNKDTSSSYNINRNVISSQLISQINDICTIYHSLQKESFENIFQNELLQGSNLLGGGGDGDNNEYNNEKFNDKKRKQTNLENVLTGGEIYDNLKKEVERILHFNYPNHLLYRCKLIVSEEGCGIQDWHYDFNKDKDTTLEEAEYAPLVVFIGVSDHCCIDIRTKMENFNKKYTRATYNRGDMVIMHGYTKHRGCSYKEINFRLFFNAFHRDVVVSTKKKKQNRDTKNTYFNLNEKLMTRSLNKSFGNVVVGGQCKQPISDLDYK